MQTITFFRGCLTALSLLFSLLLFAQDFVAVSDTFCIELGTMSDDNVLTNDLLDGPIGNFSVEGGGNGCVRIDSDGSILLAPNADDSCCRDHFLEYRINDCQGEQCFATVLVQIKCPKPDCALIDLNDIPGGGQDPSGEGPQRNCIPACENSTATYFIDYQPGYQYDWDATNGTVQYSAAPPAETQVTWGPLGPATLLLYITDPSGQIDTLEYCVTLTPSPVAAFTADAVTCLNQSTQFYDNSTGAASWYWDFGDGVTSTLPNPNHSYTVSGTYTVTLTVTSAGGTNPDGSAACCCSHTVQQQITVDPLPGPNIYWVSTLCEGDSVVYYTDATDCAVYTWTVLDANGDPVSATPLGSGDSVSVVWGAGPFGTVSLTVSGCTQQYCTQPSTVLVPIISALGDISGPTEVCRGETATYSLPKWPGVAYEWSVTGGTFVGDATGHVVTVTWDDVGPGNLSVTYGSDFLAGLPGHEGSDCTGRASLDVDVLGYFSITDGLGGTGCVSGNSFVFANSDFPGAGFTWSVVDAANAPVSSFTGQGTNSINIDWSGASGPGIYTVTAVPLSPGPGDYCVDEQSLTIELIEVLPPSFTGPDEYCPGDIYPYAIVSPDPTLLYQWTVTGGTIFSGQNGPNVLIQWTSPTGGSLSVVAIQQSPVYCVSAPSAPLNVTPITVASLQQLNTTAACINSLQSYTVLPAQHSSATYAWSISPATAGTIISGGSDPTVSIQWNDSDGMVELTVVVTVCGQESKLETDLDLDVPTPATIVQVGDLCPGVTAQLQATGGPYSNYVWSTGDSGPTASQITISSGGAYSVTTTDPDGCTAVASFVATELPGLNPFLSTGDPTAYCVGTNGMPTGDLVNLVIPTTGGYSFAWYCNNVLQTGSSGPSFTHTVTNTAGDFEYYAVVTDNTTLCIDTSNVVTVRHLNCGGNGCSAPPPNFTPTAANQTPDCSIVDLDVTMPASVVATNWELPAGTTVLSGSTSSNSLDVRFPQAGCYSVLCEAAVPNNNPPPTNCVFGELVSICVPIQADFEYSDDCGTVSFTDLTTFLPGTTITGYSWDFGDPLSSLDVSSAMNPSYTYPTPGGYLVTLTVTTQAGCMASFSQLITVGPSINPSIAVAPGPYCVGDAISFTGTAAGAIELNWSFGDGATFVGNNPQHAYAAANLYNIVLTATDAFGCSQTTTTTVTVTPNPDPVVIAVAPDPYLCPGETATLSIPAQSSANYAWSNGATGTSTTVSTAGSYDVTVTLPSGCFAVADPVAITVLPAPPATITGPSVICGQGMITLQGPVGPYSYAWTNGSGDPVGFGGSFLPVNSGATFDPPYTLTVTDANGCSSVSTPFAVQLATPPTVNISAVGSGCAGDPTTLTASSPTSGATFTWSTGTTGATLTVTQAGTYTVVATDPQTGCTGSAEFTIHPLPDLCVVPTGCYTTCAPDTICGPVGDNLVYQWSFNGLPVPGATDACLIVDVSGTYHLAVTNEFGCTAISDDLILEVENCNPCEDISTKLSPTAASDGGSCCFELFYGGLPDGIFGIQISTTDGDLTLVPGSVDPNLQEYLTPLGAIQVGTQSGGALPGEAPQSVLTFCVEDATVDPQQIIIDYLDANQEIVCSDTLETECPAEPDCLYALGDTLTCGPDQTIVYTGTFCNPADALFAVTYLQFLPLSPAAMSSLPQGITLATPLLPGDCVTVSFPIVSTEPPGSEFCYSVVAHSTDPNEDPGALCCQIEKERCLKLPDCNPCDDLGVSGVKPLSANDSPGDCCYAITLFNEVTEPELTGLELCVIDGMADLTVYTSLGGDWTASTSPDGQVVALSPTAGTLPQGTFELPPLCLDEVEQPYTQIVLKWLSKDSVVCRDTLELFCEPDCGYLETKEVDCQDGTYVWFGEFYNTSGFDMGSAYLSFDPSSGLTAYNQTINFGSPVPDGGSVSTSFAIGPPAGPGDTICFTVTLHQLNDDDFHLNCCQFEACIILPDCEIEECVCDDQFFADIGQGFSSDLSTDPDAVLLNPVATFSSCDEITWLVRPIPGTFDQVGTGYNLDYIFPASGRYRICMEVTRTLPNGDTCPERSCRNFDIGIKNPVVFPNPTTGFLIVLPESEGRLPIVAPGFRLELFDSRGQRVTTWSATDLAGKATERGFELDLRGLPAGAYLLRGRSDQEQWTKRVILLR